MRVPYRSIAIGAFFAGAFMILTRCAPEELVYEKSGGVADGSAGDGTAGTAGTAGVGGGTGWPEICGNGIDDDNNGKTDCEDPNCSTYACVDQAPSGWQGPVAVYSGPSGTLADCPKGLTSVYSGGTALSYEPAVCGACSCGDPTSSDCGVDVTYYADSVCSTSPVGSYPASSGCGASYSGSVGSLQVSGSPSGNCGAGSASPPTLSPPTFATEVRACALQSGKAAGCADGKQCAPLFEQALACVYQKGDVTCPAGYPDRHVAYESFDDSRTCSACNCSFAADGCSFSLTGYQGTACTTAAMSATTTGCYVGDVHSVHMTGANPDNPHCDPGTSQPSGCVAPATPTTLCCTAGSECPSAHGPAMVRVAAGSESYCVDTTEVTRKQYSEFLATNPSAATLPAACSWDSSFGSLGFGSDDMPVTYIDWCDAYAYCAWAGKRLCGKIGGGAVAVPTSAADSQWYNACSFGGVRKYPYGNTQVGGACATSASSVVQSHPCCQGGFGGLFDMVGSAGEWEDGCQAKGGSSPAKDQCSVRGKSACDDTSTDNRDRRSNSIGFRCCSP